MVVAGGGPAGAVCAARLADKGRRVLVLERDRHPRFHLGESMLPNSLGVLQAIGVLAEVREKFMIKRGARFVDGADLSRANRYRFDEAFHVRWDHAFQVPRDTFDELLAQRARACGAEVREGWSVTRVVRDAGRAIGVEALDPEGRLHAIDASFVVDATGRDALSAHAARDTERLPRLDRTALYSQFRGAFRDEGERAGDIQIVVFGGDAGPDALGWFWMIPFADGRTSVGAVVSRAWVAEHRVEGGGPEALFDAAVAGSPSVAAMLSGAERLFAPGAVADFSFTVRHVRGDGWLALGDATGFIDPLFSTGLHLGLCSALTGADAIDAAITAGDVSSARFEAWEQTLRQGANLFLGAVQAFYGGQLVPYLFAREQHPFLRRAITSLLAGDVFTADARWISELRNRFPAHT